MRSAKYTVLLLLLFFSMMSQAQELNYSSLSTRLIDDIEANPSAYFHIYILMEDQVDAYEMHLDFFARNADLKTRSFETLSALQAKAANTQGPILELLDNEHTINGSIHPYWISNLIFAKVKKENIASLSNRSDIAFIDLNSELIMSETVDEESTALPLPDGIEPGLAAIKAPEMWAKGYTGYGRTAFTSDTGVDPTHPALAYKYRGFYTEPDESWYTYAGDNVTPFDCGDHGTHVTGTIMGLERLTNDTIGVAFNAQWTGSATLCGIGTEDNVAAFQWAANPDDDINTFVDMPDAINNSWHDPGLEDGCDNAYVPVLNALEALGIAVVFSAGNEGPDISTMTNPHNVNTDLVNTFTIGALNGNVPSLPIAGFSSRGPSICQSTGSLLIKPEVSAPGVSVRSCELNGEYGTKSGTSMACPHVVGAILLLKEAFPYLNGTELKLALYNTCTDLGEVGEDNTFGMGIINVLEAYNYLMDQGNEPVDPVATNDVMLIDAQIGTDFCAYYFDGGTIWIENGGVDSLFTFDLLYGEASDLELINISTALGQGDRMQVEIPGDFLPAGDLEFVIEVANPNGQTDDRPLNNLYKKTISVVERMQVSASVAGLDNTICEGGSAILVADYQGVGTPTHIWYENDQPVGDGALFISPVLNETTTYTLETSYEHSVGLNTKEGYSNGIVEEIEYKGLVFDALNDFTLKSLTIFTQGFAGLDIAVYDRFNHQVASKLVTVQSEGENEVLLNFNIPKGEDNVIILRTGVPIFGVNENPGFPFIVDDVVNIKSSTLGVNDYLFFFNWQIENEEPCGPTEIVVEVNGAGTLPTASFNPSGFMLDLSTDSGIVEFENTSENATEWYWDFGDGGTSVEENPTHTYTISGEYIATLEAKNEEGCDAYATAIINVINPLSSNDIPNKDLGVSVYPNPAQDRISIQVEDYNLNEVGFTIYDIMGKVYQEGALQARQTELSINDLPSGIYFLDLQQDERRQIVKLVKH